MASNEKYTILYGRLSQEDTQKTNKTDDSNSIQNQKLLLEKYAAEKGFTNTLFLYDDGYSGTNFNRPGWQQVRIMAKVSGVTSRYRFPSSGIFCLDIWVRISTMAA